MVDARSRWDGALVGVAGLMGATGVALGAASAHLGGGDFARLAAVFLLIHAAAVPGILAVPLGSLKLRRTAAALLCLGAVLFCGDLAMLGFTGHTPISGMAPAGGFLLIAGWLAVALAAVLRLGA
ncbi:DUF423 domain-containing protein [Lichenihabitans sp. Uapishka_5]|uniref:DUF423 domain-containing protein n=1 Tax=Lichenihabitans sp. Uapishka_5 TaxID=3037302 RepID=UPI0029E81E7F|nr:DUF423 domain-containing protein [Lichenihabitans sp. Uapishka_5]MDX7949844.1 DUF423 domain-containing protein [Lichenihabitans sp. Uapishka_5]